MGHLELTPPERRSIREILDSAFSISSLNRFVRENLPPVIQREITWHGGLSDVTDDTIECSNQHGSLDELLSRLAADRPARPELRALTLILSQKPGWSAPVQSNDLDVAAALEKLTTPGDPFYDTSRLAHWMIEVERQVGLVRCGAEHGTGFLVGPDLVLTCYHVVEDLITKRVLPSDAAVKFDYRKTSRGEAPPNYSANWISLAEGWEIPHSRYSSADFDEPGLPKPNELDFALLKLSRSAGTQPPDNEELIRGWIDLSTDPPTPTGLDSLMIVQHPQNEHRPPPQLPLKIAIATPGFEQANDNGTRWIYLNSTLRGSSGSPVFDRTYRAVALHQKSGKPNGPDLAENNRGIPLAKIRSALPADVRQLLVRPPARPVG
jgi:hypothetical protein